MYFVSKVIIGVEACYQNIENLALAVVVVARKLRPYLQGHKIRVKTNYLVWQVLKKSNMEGRMVSWEVELLEDNIQYVQKGSIKSQVQVDFVPKLCSPRR